MKWVDISCWFKNSLGYRAVDNDDKSGVDDVIDRRNISEPMWTMWITRKLQWWREDTLTRCTLLAAKIWLLNIDARRWTFYLLGWFQQKRDWLPPSFDSSKLRLPPLLFILHSFAHFPFSSPLLSFLSFFSSLPGASYIFILFHF